MKYADYASKIKGLFNSKSYALMYHRVSTYTVDPWQLTVTPFHFEQQLQVLQKSCKVKPISSVSSLLKGDKKIKPFILLTFDDGYANNFTEVKYLLEKYELPATFFITTRFLDQKCIFWWDELAYIFLQSNELPPFLNLLTGGSSMYYDLTGETKISNEILQQHKLWNATQNPISKRSRIYMEIWKLLSTMLYDEQQQIMKQIREWAPPIQIPLNEGSIMTAEQVSQLSKSSLVTIGAHTHSHPALPAHPGEIQNTELSINRKILQEITKTNVDALAYPSGLFDCYTIDEVKKLGFTMAFTTKSRPIHSATDKYQIGRFQVNDWTGEEFSKNLHDIFIN